MGIFTFFKLYKLDRIAQHITFDLTGLAIRFSRHWFRLEISVIRCSSNLPLDFRFPLEKISSSMLLI